jgi:hypothetical protein
MKKHKPQIQKGKHNTVPSIAKFPCKEQAEARRNWLPYTADEAKVVCWEGNDWVICVRGTRYLRTDGEVR